VPVTFRHLGEQFDVGVTAGLIYLDTTSDVVIIDGVPTATGRQQHTRAVGFGDLVFRAASRAASTLSIKWFGTRGLTRSERRTEQIGQMRSTRLTSAAFVSDIVERTDTRPKSPNARVTWDPADKGGQTKKADRPDKAEKSEKADKSERPDKPYTIQKADKAEKVEKDRGGRQN